MDLALATNEARVRGALTASLQVLLLIALSFGISYLVRTCISSAPLQVNEDPRSSALLHGSGFNLPAELVCGSAPELWERSACNLRK